MKTLVASVNEEVALKCNSALVSGPSNKMFDAEWVENMTTCKYVIDYYLY